MKEAKIRRDAGKQNQTEKNLKSFCVALNSAG